MIEIAGVNALSPRTAQLRTDSTGAFGIFTGSTTYSTIGTERISISQAGDVTVNETGASVDFRVEGDTDANLFVTDGSADRIGVGTATPTYKVQVAGTGLATDGILVSTSAFTSIPNPGTVSGVILTARGFNMTVDGATLGATYQPTFGIGMASSRAQALLSLNNTAAAAPALLIENGRLGMGLAAPRNTIDVVGSMTTDWSDTSRIGTQFADGTAFRMGMSFLTAGRALQLDAFSSDTSYVAIRTGTVGSPVEVARFNTSANMGLGTGATISARLHVISTTEQARIGFDASNYYSTTVSSTGGVTFNAVGSSAGFTFSDPILGQIVRASGSGGIEVENSSGTDVAIFGAGGGTGTSLTGTTNIASSSADYHQIAGGTGTITDTATGSSTNISINLVPKGTGRLQANAVNVPTISSTDTITNKRNQPRTASSTSASTLTPDLSSANIYFRTTQTVTLTIEAPIGTPVIGETIVIYVDSAGAQTINFNATYIPFGSAFPTTTTAGKTLMITAQYNGTDWKTLTATQV